MTNLGIAAFFAVFATLTGYGFVSQRRRQQRMADTETSRSDQVTAGLVELEGTVRPRETVRDPMYDEDAVLADWELTEQRMDGDGDLETHTLASGRREAVFDLADGGGTIRVDPDGATLKASAANRAKETFRGSDERLDTLKERTDGDQGGTSVQGVSVQADGVNFRIDIASDDRRTYRHETLRPGDDVYVLGTAERDEEGMIVGKGDARREYVLSDMSEEEVSDTFGQNKWILAAIAGAASVLTVYFLLP